MGRSGRWILVISLLGLHTELAAGAVHADCLDAQWGVTCHKGRIEDVKTLDALFTPVIGRAGWDRRCFDVQIIKGDAGGPDAIMVVLHGPRNGRAPDCRTKPLPELTPAEKAEVARRSKDFDELFKNTVKKSGEKAAAQAAGPVPLDRLGQELKKAIMAAEKQVRSRLLKNTDAIELGDGWVGQATIKL